MAPAATNTEEADMDVDRYRDKLAHPLLAEISNNLDDIRKELRIANQLKLIELQHLSAEVFTPTALSELWTKLSAMLTVTPRSKKRV